MMKKIKNKRSELSPAVAVTCLRNQAQTRNPTLSSHSAARAVSLSQIIYNDISHDVSFGVTHGILYKCPVSTSFGGG